MNNLLWEIIEKTKKGHTYVKSEEQYAALEQELAHLDVKTVQQLRDVWGEEVANLFGDEFDKLHVQNGGIVYAGDDGFYMDFADWVLVQGKDLVEHFKEKGHKVILNYIERHKIQEKDYLFECMGYAFYRRLNDA